MITQSNIYWITRLDELRKFLGGLGDRSCFMVAIILVVTVVLVLVSTLAGNGNYEMFSGMSDEKFEKLQQRMRTIAKRGLWIALIFFMLVHVCSIAKALTPSSKEMAAIMVIPRVANSESIQNMGQEIVDLAQEWLHELHPKKSQKEERP